MIVVTSFASTSRHIPQVGGLHHHPTWAVQISGSIDRMTVRESARPVTHGYADQLKNAD
jgi:hypothetical protein